MSLLLTLPDKKIWNRDIRYLELHFNFFKELYTFFSPFFLLFLSFSSQKGCKDKTIFLTCKLFIEKRLFFFAGKRIAKI